MCIGPSFSCQFFDVPCLLGNENEVKCQQFPQCKEWNSTKCREFPSCKGGKKKKVQVQLFRMDGWPGSCPRSKLLDIVVFSNSLDFSMILVAHYFWWWGERLWTMKRKIVVRKSKFCKLFDMIEMRWKERRRER